MKNRAPLIVAIILLLLPAMYVGSYFALVRPDAAKANLIIDSRSPVDRYRFGGRPAEFVFYPLEWIDRRVRPRTWELQYEDLPLLPESASYPEILDNEEILPGEPTIVHVLNWHYVTREAFAANTGLAGEELEREYAAAMERAGAVHRSLLTILANQPEVYLEGLTDQNEATVAAELHSLAAYHTLLRREGGNDPDHERTLLRLGAAAELALDGNPIKLLPAEGSEHEAARPINGQIDEDLQAARDRAIVRRIVTRKKSAYLVLGGDHDLTEAIRPTGWGYVRITPRGYRD